MSTESRPAEGPNETSASGVDAPARNVAAVIVTFNRLEKLKRVLTSLEKQTRLPQSLVIINNASTDDTASYLADYEASFSLSDKVSLRVVTLDTNTGGAGGFSRGMQEGYDAGADFVWIFDDDGYPQPDALERLLAGYDGAVEELGPDVPFACSVVKFIDGSICEMNNPVTTWDWGRLLAKGQNSVLVSSCSFVSVLIPRWVMESFGLPYKEYFIWYDDAEYTQRISGACPGIQVLDSVVLHDMGENRGVNFGMVNEKNAWKFAYGVRNQASYRLHHRSFGNYLIFCIGTMRDMKHGGVSKALRRKMRGKMLEALRFNPKPDFPQGSHPGE